MHTYDKLLYNKRMERLQLIAINYCYGVQNYVHGSSQLHNQLLGWNKVQPSYLCFKKIHRRQDQRFKYIIFIVSYFLVHCKAI